MPGLREVRKGMWHLRGRCGAVQDLAVPQRTEQGFAEPRNVQGVEAAWTGRGRKRRLSLIPAALPQHQPSRPDVRAAVILEQLSALAFGYEWTTSAVHPHTWRSDLASDAVDLLFVESAWAGNGGPVARKADRPQRAQQRVPRAGPVVPGAGDSHSFLEQGGPAAL